MTTFKVYDLISWPGDEEDSWEVDSWTLMGEYQCEYNNEEILHMLKEEGFIGALVAIDDIHFVDESNGVIQLCDAHDMKPIYNLFYEA